MNKVVIACPNCNGHSQHRIFRYGEIFFNCPFCRYSASIIGVEKHYGEILLDFKLPNKNPENQSYCFVTGNLEKIPAIYYVLCNGEVIAEFTQMFPAIDLYNTIVKELQTDSAFQE